MQRLLASPTGSDDRDICLRMHIWSDVEPYGPKHQLLFSYRSYTKSDRLCDPSEVAYQK